MMDESESISEGLIYWKYYTENFLEELNENKETSVKVVEIPAEVRTGYLSNTSLVCYRRTIPFYAASLNIRHIIMESFFVLFYFLFNDPVSVETM
jgi:hypothetical protein